MRYIPFGSYGVHYVIAFVTEGSMVEPQQDAAVFLCSDAPVESFT